MYFKIFHSKLTINLTVIVRKITSSLLINQENSTKMTYTPFLYSRMKEIFSVFSVSRFAAVRTFEFFYLIQITHDVSFLVAGYLVCSTMGSFTYRHFNTLLYKSSHFRFYIFLDMAVLKIR